MPSGRPLLACILWQLVLVACASAVAAPASGPTPTAQAIAQATATPPPSPSATAPPATATPIPVTPQPAQIIRATIKDRPIAVSIENEMAARPQAGLADADVVYEAVAEWDLTRFVALFAESSPEAVGPVRSGRDYQAAIAAEYEAAFADCLGVPSVAQVVAATKVVNLDGCRVSNPLGFWRDWDRRAPHNLYVTVPTLRKVAGGTGTYGGLSDRQGWLAAPLLTSRLVFEYPPGHPIEWRYDSLTRKYLRWQDGAPHVDMAGTQLNVAAVVVQFVVVRDTSYYGERGYHDLALVGEGEALLYANGDKRTAKWRRPQLTEPTRFYDAKGERVLLPPGRIFVQIVGRGTQVKDTGE